MALEHKIESEITVHGEISPYENHLAKSYTEERYGPDRKALPSDSYTVSGVLQVEVVDFDGPSDPMNPQNWSKFRKWTIVILVSLMTLMTNVATIICAPAAPEILKTFHVDNAEYSSLLVSVWEVGEIISPLIIAPLSELYGRLWIYLATNALFVIFSVGDALSTNISMVVAFRALTGLAVACQSLNPAIVGDMFIQEERGRPMAMMEVAPFIGVITGPIIGGYISAEIGWRWTFWVIAIATGACTLGFGAFLRETYIYTIIERKAKHLRKTTGNQALKSKYHVDTSSSELFKEAILRPANLLLHSPVLLIISFYMAVLYGIFYSIMTTITEVVEAQYKFSTGTAGLSFIAVGIGMAIGVLLCEAVLDKYMQRKATRTGKDSEQEDRLPLVIVGGLAMPIGLFLYGWTSEHHVFWIVPIIGTGILGIGLILTTVPVITYLVDLFGRHAASAIAASIVLKNTSGALFPLAGPALYEQIGYGWGNTVLGFIAVAFLPVPIFLLKYGKRIRTSRRLSAEH